MIKVLHDLQKQIREAEVKVHCLEQSKRSRFDDNADSPNCTSTHIVDERGHAHKRRRRSTNFDDLARKFFTQSEQIAMTSVVGRGGKLQNGFCSNGCLSADGGRKLGQRNMVIRLEKTGEVCIGKWCYKCITECSVRKKKVPAASGGTGGYACTRPGCWREGVGARVDASGCVVAGSLTCGCNF